MWPLFCEGCYHFQYKCLCWKKVWYSSQAKMVLLPYKSLGVIIGSTSIIGSCWGKIVSAAFLDVRKAFNSLDYALLLQSLYQLGICNTVRNLVVLQLPQWSCPASEVQSFLLWLETCFGGNSPRSVLGPLLFMWKMFLYRYRMGHFYNLLTFVWSAMVIIIHRLRTFWVIIIPSI